MSADAGWKVPGRSFGGFLALTSIALALPQLACGEGAEVVLGYRAATIVFSDQGRRPAAINSTADDDNPTFTRDLLVIYYTSERGGSDDDGDVWCAQRDNRVMPFGRPRPVAAVNSRTTETSVAVSLDGLTLWVGSERPSAMGGDGDSDIWRSTRPPPEEGDVRPCDEGWSEPEQVEELNSPEKDIPRPLGMDETIMPIGSLRDDAHGPFQTFFAHRPSPGEPFGTPLRDGLEGIGRGQAMVDAFLSADGLFLFYNQGEAGKGDLVMAWRKSVDDAFAQEIPLDGINTPADERDPWLNPDGDRFFFTRDSGEGRGLDIFGTSLEFFPQYE